MNELVLEKLSNLEWRVKRLRERTLEDGLRLAPQDRAAALAWLDAMTDAFDELEADQAARRG